MPHFLHLQHLHTYLHIHTPMINVCRICLSQIGCCVIFDCKGLGRRHFSALKAFKAVNSVLEPNFPEVRKKKKKRRKRKRSRRG